VKQKADDDVEEKAVSKRDEKHTKSGAKGKDVATSQGVEELKKVLEQTPLIMQTDKDMFSQDLNSGANSVKEKSNAQDYINAADVLAPSSG